MLVACFSSWSASWQESEAGDAAYQGLLLEGQQKKLLQEQQARGDALEREVERLRREAEEQLATAAEAQRAALEAQLAEITDAYGDKERQERRLAVGMKAAKRIQNQGILRGWGAWHEQWEEKSRKMRMLAAASARLSRPMVVACMTQWREDWQNEHLSAGQQAHAAVIQQLKENHKQATAQARRESAAARIVQEEVISDLEAEMRAYLERIETVIPAKEPRYLILHSISAIGVPDADAAGGSDPYVRFILLDHDGPEKQVGCTTFKRKEINPVWNGERLQFKLALGGQMPPPVRVTVWDKDFNKADDPIARATVTLGEGLEGKMSLPVGGVEGNDDVQSVSFSYTFAVEEEEIIELDAARAAEMKPRKPRASSGEMPFSKKKKEYSIPLVSKGFGAGAASR